MGGAKPLPVNFASITANKNGTGVAVKWLMSDQASISSYSAERSIDGIHFEAIATVKVASSSTYQVHDDNIPVSAMLYYRIKAIGVDGSYKYSNVVKLNTNKLPPATISIYPNPVHDKLKVTLNNVLNGTFKVRIITIAGTVAYSQSNALIDGNELTLDARNLASGVYMLELTDEKGNKLMDKFVKE